MSWSWAQSETRYPVLIEPYDGKTVKQFLGTAADPHCSSIVKAAPAVAAEIAASMKHLAISFSVASSFFIN